MLVNDEKAKKDIRKLPKHILTKYMVWKNTILLDGVDKLRTVKGFHFEKLQGKREGQNSCRLSQGYRVIFEISNEVITVFVLEVNKHEY